MTSTRLWDRAASLPVPVGAARHPQLASLPSDLPAIGQLFDFMRDAELRFGTLRMRIEERSFTARGEHLVVLEIALRHPGDAKVTTIEPSRGPVANHELWVSDGEIVRTYSAAHKLGTQRPARHRVRGLDSDFPGASRVYESVTPLPMETLPETFVHPAGYCQNVLATGSAWVSGTDIVAGREAIILVCDHPRTIEMAADRPDFRVEVAVDRATGVILRLVESIGGEVTRDAQVTTFEPDAPLAPNTFEFTFPPDATMLF
jgi:outer membrane lipoprotein-sorting protein